MARSSAADERYERTLRALGIAVLGLQRENGDGHLGKVRITDLRFKLDADNRTSVLVILKGDGEAGPVVGFVGAPDLETSILSLWGRVMGDGVKWREDRPWSGPKGS